MIYAFGQFRLDPTERSLARGEKRLPLPPKAIDTLLTLVESRGRLVTKEELLDRVWPDTHVSDATLAQNVFTLRKALEENGSAERCIETVPKRGYRFIAPVEEVTDSAPIVEEKAQSVTPHLTSTVVRGSIAVLLTLAALTAYELRPSRSVRSLAVLPLRMVVSSETTQHIGVGLTDAIIADLGRQLDDVAVRPTTAVLGYERADPVTAGRAMGVDAVLHGTVQSVDERLRVNLRLLRVADGKALWSDSVHGHLADLFALEDQISARTARQVGRTLGQSAGAGVKRPTTQSRAYRAWLLGRYQWARRPEGVPAAIAHFREAIERDPQYVDAYVGLAQCYAGAPERNGPVEAIALARYALSLEPGRGDAHAVLGMAAMKMFDWRTAEREYQLSLQMDPNDASTRTFYGVLLIARKRVDAAVEELRKAVELDPTSVNTNITLGAALIYANRHNEAVEQLHRTRELNPNSHWVRLRLAQAYLAAGRNDEALAELKRVRELDVKLGDVALAHAYATLGKPYDALRHLRQLPEEGAGGPYRMALVYAGLGDNDSAFRWLDRAVQDRHWDLYAIGVDQRLDGLRGDARFAELAAAVRLD